MKAPRLESIFFHVLLVTAPIGAGAAASGCFIGGTSCSDDGEPHIEIFTLSEAGDAGDGGTDAGVPEGGVTSSNCADLCFALDPGEIGLEGCGPTKDENGKDAVSCTFVPYCEGRRPAGLARRPLPSARSEVGRFFARAAHNEAASVDAFLALREELRAHRAPQALVRASTRAARDEVRHARMTAALARRYGAAPERPLVERVPPRSLDAIAAENAAEGCVRETYGALLAAWQGRAAADPVVRAVMRRIAADEARHAALGWQVARWAEGRLDRARRARADEARYEAWRALTEAATQEVPEALVRAAGMPRPAHARAMLDELARALPIARAAAALR